MVETNLPIFRATACLQAVLTTLLASKQWRYRGQVAGRSQPAARLSAALLLPIPIVWMFVVLLAGVSLSQSTERDIHIRVERGLTGSVPFTYRGKVLKAKPQRDSESAIVMRLSSSESDRYEAQFLGNKEGSYDLREFIEHVDGSAASDLPRLLVEIVSTLPKDERSDLFLAASFQPKVWGGYRMSLFFLGLIWLSIPIAVGVRRAMKPKPIAMPQIVEVKPTFADQIQPLVEAAAAGKLSIREKGRLELLLVHYWRERISLNGVDMASSIRQLRIHPEAGRLVTTVERWLHQRDSSVDGHGPSNDDCSAETILELLKPYRGSSARGTS